MKTLTRYIFKKFLTTILLVFVLFLCLIYLIDFIEMLRIALKKGGSAGDAMLLSALRVPSFAEMALPIAILIGGIGAFLNLSKNSELIIARACGMSVWQFIRPALIVGILFGLGATMAYNPLAVRARSHAEELQAQMAGKGRKHLILKKNTWLRQDGPDGQSIIHARHVSRQGERLSLVTVFQYDHDGRFVERIDAREALLKERRWLLRKATVSAVNEEPRHFDSYIVSTYLTKSQVTDSLGSADLVSFWQLPKLIKTSEKAGLPASQYRMQYQELLSRPLWMIAMILLAATASIQSFRFGNVQKNILLGMVAGFGFFIFAQISKNMGLSGHSSMILAAWGPPLLACLAAIGVLIRQEDG